MRRLTIVFLAVALAFGVGAARPAPALAGGGDNAAIAINTKDGSTVFRLAFSITRVAGDVVDNTNAAVAFASCTSCETVAIAIQVVLVTGDPSVVTPTNLAIAVNMICNLCVTVADAYQFVTSTGGPVHFTADGNRELAQIRHDLEALRNQDLTLEQLQAKLTDIVGRLKTVLTTQLVPAGQSGEEHGNESTTGTSTTTTTPVTTTAPATTTTAPTTTTTTTTPTTTATTTTTP